MYECVPPFLALLLFATTGALFSDGTHPGSETNTKPPEMSNISAGTADLGSSTNATFPSVPTTHKNKVMDTTAFPVKIFEPPPSKHTERELPTAIPLIEPTGRNDALSPSPKAPGDITMPPMDQETEFQTIIPSTTIENTGIQPGFTKKIIDATHNTENTHSHQPISSLSTPTSKPQANTALPRFTTEPSDHIIPSTTKEVTSIQPEFTKNIIDVAHTAVYTHSHQETFQPISSSSTPTPKPEAKTALPRFSTDNGSTGPSDIIIPSTTIGITGIQPEFTKNAIDVTHTAVYTHSHRETSQLMSSSYIATTSIPSSSSMSAPVTCITTNATTMQETIWPTNDMPITITEETTTAPLTHDKTPPTILPLKSKVSNPMPPSVTMTKTLASFSSSNPGTMLPAITSTRKTSNVTGSWSPKTKFATMPPGPEGAPIAYSVTPQSSPAPYPSIDTNTSPTMDTTEEQSSEITDTRPEDTLPPKLTVSNSGGRIILRVKLESSPTTNVAVAMRELLQQTCLLLDQEISAEDVTLSWGQQMFLPCVTVMGIGL